MKEALEQVVKKLDAGIAANEREENVLKRVSLNRYLAQDTLLDILSPERLDFDYFLDEYTQILYSKYYLPPLLAKWLLFLKEYKFECRLLYSTEERRKVYFQRELVKVRGFFIRNRQFCQYYYSNRTEEDACIFTGNNPSDGLFAGKLARLFPIVNAGCFVAAAVIANEEYGRFLQKRLFTCLDVNNKKDPKAGWNANEIDLVEQIMVQHAGGTTIVNGKPATQKFLIEEAKKYYGVELKNWEQLAQKIKNRPGDPLSYHKRIMDEYRRRQDLLLDQNFDQQRKKIKRF